MPETACGGASAFGEGVVNVEAREKQRGNGGEQNHCEESNDGGKRKRVRMKAQLVEEWEAFDHRLGYELDDDGGEPRGEEHSGGTSGDGEQQCFGYKLREDPRGSCAERSADGDFSAPAFGADEQKTCNVDAGDEKQERRAGEKSEQDGANVADGNVFERLDVCALAAVAVGVLALEIGGDALHLFAGGLDGDSIAEAGNAVEIVAAAAGLAGVAVEERYPE